MKDILDIDSSIDGYSETRERVYPTYIPGDTKIEGYCTFNELKQKIERLEKLIEQLLASVPPSPDPAPNENPRR